jgi:hypothetical protein
MRCLDLPGQGFSGIAPPAAKPNCGALDFMRPFCQIGERDFGQIAQRCKESDASARTLPDFIPGY